MFNCSIADWWWALFSELLLPLLLLFSTPISRIEMVDSYGGGGYPGGSKIDSDRRMRAASERPVVVVVVDPVPVSLGDWANMRY